jgi:L-threonylcarbamoyladenylate synthase
MKKLNAKGVDLESLKKGIAEGNIFIYPTDTIYGLGCDATKEEIVEKLKEIKSRDKEKPLSVIAPSFEWISENFIFDYNIKKYLPGAYTLLLKKKNPDFLIWISPNDRIGVRIPANRFTKKIQKSGVPFVTTSVNLAGEPFALKIKDIKQEIIEKVDYVIEEDEQELSGKPSTLIIDGKEMARK